MNAGMTCKECKQLKELLVKANVLQRRKVYESLGLELETQRGKQ